MGRCVEVMKPAVMLAAAAAVSLLGLTSCADPEKKPVGPTTDTSKIPWNRPISGQGQGQFGMMQQNMYRR